jgi:hypothetical protein
MGGKYLLHIIIEIISMIGPLRDFIYTYKCREIITTIWIIILDWEAWQLIMHVFNTFILGDRLGSGI